MTRIAIVGGHGQVARQLIHVLRRAEHDPVALVRREEYRADLEDRGAEVRLLDIEQHDAAAFAAAFEGCGAVLFGEPTGKNPFAWVFSGHHLTLRCDGNSEPGSAWGGPIWWFMARS